MAQWGGFLDNQQVYDQVEGFIDGVKLQAQDAYSTAIGILNGLAAFTGFDPIDTDVDWDAIEIPIRSWDLGPLPTKPVLDPLDDPPISFEYTETPYVSSLLNALKSKLLYDILNFGTGLSESVENAMYDREKERDQRALSDTVDRIATRWSESGFTLPDGILTAMTSMADVEYQNKLSDKSRKIEEDSFKIAMDHQHFILTTSSSLEDVLMKMNGETNKNKILAATAILEAGIKIFEAQVKEQLSKVELYKAEAQAYEANANAIGAIAKADSAIIEARIAYNSARANVALKQIEMQIKQLEVQLGITSSIAKAIADVASRLAAGALSAINAGVSMGYSGTDHNSANLSESASANHNWNYNTSDSHQSTFYYYWDMTKD